MPRKWSAVTETDARQFSNVPMQCDDSYRWEVDTNPQAWRRRDHYEWVRAGHIPGEKRIHNFYRDQDTDTTNDDWVVKEIILGAVVSGRVAEDQLYGWSSVVRAVIRREEKKRARHEEWLWTNYYANRKPVRRSGSLPTDLIRYRERKDNAELPVVTTSRRSARLFARNRHGLNRGQSRRPLLCVT